MKAKDLRELSNEELSTKERDLREDLFKLSFQHGVRRLDNTATLRELRKNIARIKTVIHAKQA